MATHSMNAGTMPAQEVDTEVNPNLISAQDRLSQPHSGVDPAGVFSSGQTSVVTTTGVAPAPRRGALTGLSNLPVTRRIQVLGTLLLLCLVAAAGAVYLDARTAGRLAVSTSTATAMQMLSQRMAKAAQQAVQGSDSAFAQLRASRDRFAADLELLRDGGADLAPAQGEAAEVLTEVSRHWQGTAGDIQLILSQRGNLLKLRENDERIAAAAPRIGRLTQQLATLADTPRESYRVRTLVLQLDADVANYRFVDAVRLLSTDRPNPRVAFLLGKNVRKFSGELGVLLGGTGATIRDSDALATAEALQETFAPFAASVEGILANIESLAAAKQASRDIFAASEGLLQQSQRLTEIYAAERSERTVTVAVAVVLGLLALACIILIAKVYLEDARSRAAQSEREYRRNQEAIIRLLDEMQGIAEGNLTIRARVTDDITGAIADSVNFAIEELGSLVYGINEASTELGAATEEARGISSRLLLAAERQTNNIRGTTSSVLGIAKSIKRVSDHSVECVRVAERSLAASEKGSAAVQASISGMNAIRGQIQETSKRIKRLGESSQEIGEIVELIADITEQTNVLALNAAIQAASAGPAGRGFSVVAEEVQRLAERSAEATQQIAAIVKTIQTDTQDTVMAMEKSTQGVVEGARVSDAAGQALGEIGQVSRQLAGMITEISTTTRKQTEQARRAALSMNEILKITEQTSAGTQRTNTSMEKVNELATGLSDSVSGFRL